MFGFVELFYSLLNECGEERIMKMLASLTILAKGLKNHKEGELPFGFYVQYVPYC